MMYAFSKLHPKLDYGFVPHRYRMYSGMLDAILTIMEDDGMVCISPTEGGRYGSNLIHLTNGYQAAKQFVGDDDALETLQIVKSELNPLTYRQFRALIYTQFPEMLEKNELVDQYESWRKKEAVSMYNDGKVTFSVAWRISGLNPIEFSRASAYRFDKVI